MKNTGNQRPRAHSQLNRSQVITLYGPGAMVDLLDEAVLISGLNHWARGRQIREPRLLRHLRRQLQLPQLALHEPPLDDESEERTAPGIHAMVFPGWFLGDVERTLVRKNKVYRTQPMFKISEIKGGKANFEGKRISVTPMRFVRACEDGHLEDIDWHFFLFRGAYKEHRARRLWLDEGGSGNDLSELFVRCEDQGEPVCMVQATLPDSPVLGKCHGGLPWLAYDAHELCTRSSLLLIRSASNAYFSKTLTSISLPELKTDLQKLVAQLYEDLFAGELSLEHLKIVLSLPLARSLAGYPAEQVWAEILRHRGEEPEQGRRSLKAEELAVLLAQSDEIGGERPEDLEKSGAEPFLARNRRLSGLSANLQARLDRIVLVHRLTEVMVQVGFTRFKPDMPEINGEYKRLRSSPLAPKDELSWLPAVENQGEGVFLAFKPAAIEAWKERPGSQARIALLRRGFEAWQLRKERKDRSFPDPAYYMLHSLAHLLITSVAMECGYNASAIKERIYAGPEGYGILLYTWTPGSAGTLGGLIEVARSIEKSLAYALELGELCSNDPVCAYHQPDNAQEERFLSGAACHGCLLISEPCCEQGNDLLDRALVVPTVDCADAAFFPREPR